MTDWLMTIVEAISPTVMVLSVLVMVRSTLVFRMRMRRLSEVSRAARANIAGDWEKLYEEYDRQSYESMTFDLTKWTYRQFYPKRPGEGGQKVT